MEVPEWKRQLLARRKSGSVTLMAGGTKLVVTRPNRLPTTEVKILPSPNGYKEPPKLITPQSPSKPPPGNNLPKPVLSNGRPKPLGKVNATAFNGNASNKQEDVQQTPIMIQINGEDKLPERGVVSAMKESLLKKYVGEDRYPPTRGRPLSNYVRNTMSRFEPARSSKRQKKREDSSKKKDVQKRWSEPARLAVPAAMGI